MVSYVRADHIGRPVFATNASGVKVWSATYTPFGGVTTSTGVVPTARFPGQWFQSESGLHQNWMRDYAPTTGRYLEADPLALVDGASVYGYVRQSPIMLTDPTGKCPWCAAAAWWAVWMLVDYLDDDGCYTWQDFWWSAATNVDPFKANKWERAADGAEKATRTAWKWVDEIIRATKGHDKGKRPSTKEKHEKGDARRGQDRGGERGDESRSPPRKAPPDYKGPWPPKPSKAEPMMPSPHTPI